MNYSVEIVKTANELPESWDQLITDYFQSKEFLLHTEKYNSCNQRYYLWYANGILKAGTITYSLRLDLLTYLAVKSPFTMHISGVPCSVSSSGIVGDENLFSPLIEAIKKHEKGMLLLLNLNDTIQVSNMLMGRTLPTMLFSKKFESYADYLSSLRAPYRRRIKQITSAFSGVEKQQLSCRRFTKEMYAQYLGVLKRSKGKLESLSFEFFQQLPSAFILKIYVIDNCLLGWKITVQYAQKYYFFLGGINYSLNRRYSTYYNLLLDVLKEGIECNADEIDFGQTAEVPKMRLGCSVDEKTMMARHSNPLLNSFLRVGKKALEYSTLFEEVHVFKEDQ